VARTRAGIDKFAKLFGCKLTAGGQVSAVGVTVGFPPSTLELCQASTPTVVLMDICMPGMDGIAATRELSHERSPTRVLILTTSDTDEYVYAAMKAGASGFLLKSAPPAQLTEAIRVVASGDALLAPAITRRLIEEFVSRPAPGSLPKEADALTERELEVLRLIARGLSNSEIATKLVVSEATIKTHINRLFSKLNLRDRVQAVVLAYETGLVRPGSD
jgi:DNA-binding NarL/FixJ family response regulator